jgi:hypothetical protein
MQVRKLLVIFLICSVGCKSKNIQQNEKFDRVKWAAKLDREYPYRDKMLTDLMTNYELHGIKKDSVLKLLGPPNRIDNGHLFYLVVQTYFPNTSFPLHTKTLVIKLTQDSTVEWRKIHE